MSGLGCNATAAHACSAGAALAQNFAGERQQRYMAGAFDRLGQGALVLGACTCLAPGADFAIISHKTAQYFGLLVIDGGVLIRTELAFAWTGEKAPPTGLWLIA
jgi:hypothetical protein